MRKRIFDKKVKKLNLVTNIIDSASVTAAALTATAGTVTTLQGTTAGIDTVNASKAVNVSGLATVTNLTINTAFKVPLSGVVAEARLSGGDYYGTFWFSGLHIYVAKSGTYVSGVLA